MDAIKLPLRIFAVDPATTVSGWALLELVSLDPVVVHVLKRGELDGSKLFRQRKEMATIFDRQFCVLDVLHETYVSLIEEHRPDVVCSEGAFAAKHVSAALAISLAIYQVRRAAQKVLGRDAFLIAPTISKKAWTGSGNADKDAMRLVYQTRSPVIDLHDDPNVSEHEIDAIAHGYAYVCRDILGTVVQISALEVKRAKRERAKLKEEAQKNKTG